MHKYLLEYPEGKTCSDNVHGMILNCGMSVHNVTILFMTGNECGSCNERFFLF